MLFALQRESDHWRREYEKLLLRLKNELLKFERRLPPSKPADDEPRISEYSRMRRKFRGAFLRLGTEGNRASW